MNVVRFELQSEICDLKSEINMAAQKDLCYSMRVCLKLAPWNS